MSDRMIGLDFGSRVAVTAAADAAGSVQVVDRTPTAICFARDGATPVGDAAVAAAGGQPDRAVLDVRSRLADEAWRIDVDGVEFGAADVAALIMREIVANAEAALGPIPGAVITVPAYFHDGQRRAVLEAGAGAGVTTIRFLNEASAAALAYAARERVTGSVLVCTVDDGSLDASVVEIESPRQATLRAMSGGRADEGVEVAKRALRDAGLKRDRIGAVIVTGAGEAPDLGGLFECTPLAEIDPRDVVAHGAALHAAALDPVTA